eukprot:g16117.t1
MSITVTPQPSGFGADISGIDLRKPLSRQDRQDILQAWYRHQVVVFPDQDLSPAHLVAFAGHFGPFAKEPFVQPLSDQPQVIEVRREADEACIPFGASWHSDWSFLAKPPSATLLQSKVIPPVGGDTLFADSYRAYDTLDPDLKAQLRGLKALHSARRAYTPANYRAAGGDQRSMHIRPSEQAWAVQMHPLVRRHPATGKLCLWINPVYTVGICGLDHRVDNADLVEIRPVDTALPGQRAERSEDGTVTFSTMTRGDTSSYLLKLENVQRSTKIRLDLVETRETGGAPPIYRPQQRIPAASVALNLRDMTEGRTTFTQQVDTYTDSIVLRRVLESGPREAQISFTDDGTRQGDYYYLRVVQANDAMAWSSPVWIGGHPPR